MSKTPPRRAPLPPTPTTPSGPNGPQTPALLNELQSEIATEAAPLLQFMIKNAALIVGVLLLFVAILAGTAGYNWYTARAAQKAQTELARVLISTQGAERGAERVTALEAFIALAPATIRTAALLALAEAAVAQENFALAAKTFGDVAASDPKGAVGLLAGLNQGQALLRIGGVDEAKQAVAVLEIVEANTPEARRFLVRQILAEAAVAAGNTARAKEAFEALTAASTGSEAEFYRYRISTLTQ